MTKPTTIQIHEEDVLKMLEWRIGGDLIGKIRAKLSASPPNRLKPGYLDLTIPTHKVYVTRVETEEL